MSETSSSKVVPPNRKNNFASLYLIEAHQLDSKTPDDWRCEAKIHTGESGEPWVKSTPKNRFGLALSGGGIRSATFNLGLLQAFGQLGILKNVDYLSTVSGGGYVGGFWTAWLHRQREKSPGVNLPENFPTPKASTAGETAEVRHLREFSRFLLPQVAVLKTEFWVMVMTVLSGMMISLLAALAVLVLGWCGWLLALTMPLAAAGEDIGSFDMVTSTVLLLLCVLGFLMICESHWQADRPEADTDKTNDPKYMSGVILGLFLVGAAWYFGLYFTKAYYWRVTYDLLSPWAAFFPAAVFGVCTVFLFLLRPILYKFFKYEMSRVTARFLGLTVGLAAIAVLWTLGGLVISLEKVSWTAGGTATATGLFLWLRKWLDEAPRETHGGKLLQTAGGILKRATPKTLAAVALILILILVGIGIRWVIMENYLPGKCFLFLPIGSGIILVMTLWLFDPARMGMHEFYRSRICRCYLGASNQPAGTTTAGANRHLNEQEKDDLTLGELAKVKPEPKSGTKPLHLICTAANDLASNPVGTLYRGARSAVISANGISMGNDWAERGELKLSSVLTASAAAFNSQMGRISIDLGPAVTFLMTAFNLRLGLWVKSPLTQQNKSRWENFPGRFFLLELFGQTKASADFIHLSDGNHFEDFGLYELIRRHCTYIIVSDCGADPEVAFDDLANVLRRVREDFGVEIELDISRLRPGANGQAQQHAVVGSIHYDGPAGFDKGTIIFFKPALTGDEPPDVLQYHTRNGAFPHETTGDQFYDEAQWESYRRLGEHAARSVLGFFEKPKDEKSDGASKADGLKKQIAGNVVNRLFLDARSRWHPAPDQLNEQFLAMSERCADLEADLATDGLLRLRVEFFAEAAALAGFDPAKATPKSKSPFICPDDPLNTKPDLREDLDTLGFLIRVIQIMEDVWVAGDFDRYWSHPLNEGWMNYFHRWTATPSLRRWWPILSPIYNLRFRKFAESRFALGLKDPQLDSDCDRKLPMAQLALKPIDKTDIEAFKKQLVWKQFLQRHHDDGSRFTDKQILGYHINLLARDGALIIDETKLWVGFVLVAEKTAEKTAEWKEEEFFVPPALHGGGIVRRMLDAVIVHYQTQDFSSLQTDFGPKDSKTLSTAARLERVNKIEFYKSRGFSFDGKSGKELCCKKLSQPTDTLTPCIATSTPS